MSCPVFFTSFQRITQICIVCMCTRTHALPILTPTHTHTHTHTHTQPVVIIRWSPGFDLRSVRGGFLVD